MFQNYICDDYNWSKGTARTVYSVLTSGDHTHPDYARWNDAYGYLLNGDWQIENLLLRYEARIKRTPDFTRCRGNVVRGEAIPDTTYCALTLHNFGAGRDYVARVVAKKQAIYNNLPE